MFGDDGQVFRAEKSFQQQDGLAETRIAQLHRIPYIQQRVSICPGQGFRRPQQAMPVAIRLDHRHDAGGRRGAARHLKIALQRTHVYVGLYRARHENRLIARLFDSSNDSRGYAFVL